MKEKNPVALLFSLEYSNPKKENGQSIRVDSIQILLEQEGYHVLTLHLRRFSILKVFNLIIKLKPKIVVGTSFVIAPALLGARILSAPVWIDFMDSAVLTRAHATIPRKLYFKIVEKNCLNIVAKKALITSHSSELDRQFDRKYLNNNSFVLPNYIHTKPKPYQKAKIIRGVFIGDLNYGQNLLSARKLRKISKSALEIQIFGESKNKAIQLELNARYAETLVEMYQKGDIHFCLNSSPAGIKNKVINALLNGIPVITTKEGMNGIAATPGIFQLSDDISLDEQISKMLERIDIPDQEILWTGYEKDESRELRKFVEVLKS